MKVPNFASFEFFTGLAFGFLGGMYEVMEMLHHLFPFSLCPPLPPHHLRLARLLVEVRHVSYLVSSLFSLPWVVSSMEISIVFMMMLLWLMLLQATSDCCDYFHDSR